MKYPIFLTIALAAAVQMPALEAADKIEHNPYGVCAHVSRGELEIAPQEFKRMHEADITWVRTDFDWGGVETKQGSWNFDRLDKISSMMPGYPLVLHGASSVPQEFVDMANKYGGKLGNAKGVPEEMLRKAAKSGVCKINIDSDIRLAMTANIRKYMVEHPEAFDPRAYLKPAREAVKNMVQRKIRNVLGSSNKI